MLDAEALVRAALRPGKLRVGGGSGRDRLRRSGFGIGGRLAASLGGEQQHHKQGNIPE
jgi:hypothetical protein